MGQPATTLQPKKITRENLQEPIISHERDHEALEHIKCAALPAYFIDTYLKIEDPNARNKDWFDFKLWPAQQQALEVIHKKNKVVVLKARQLGLSWLTLGYALWMMIFQGGSTILVFSRGKDEAKELIRRIRGMYNRLPEWLKPPPEKELEQELHIKVGERISRIKSFATTKDSGRSYTASLVIVDEAAFIPFLDAMLNAAEETADAGGKMVVISTNDKERPNNGFANLYRKATEKRTEYTPLFIPWYARPGRDDAWYENKRINKAQDDLWQEYPAVPAEALASKKSSKRFDEATIAAATLPDEPLSQYGRAGLPKLPGITYYAQPDPNRTYLVVIDPAEGDITNDPSALGVWDALMWQEVAYMQGAYEPATIAGYAYRLGQTFNNAIICPERNNHGHAVILALRDIYSYENIYKSPFDKKLGWLTGPRTKTIAMDKLADLMGMGEFGIRSKIILAQLADIDANTQEASEGNHDDAAMVAVIAAAALTWPSKAIRKRTRRLASVSM